MTAQPRKNISNPLKSEKIFTTQNLPFYLFKTQLRLPGFKDDNLSFYKYQIHTSITINFSQSSITSPQQKILLELHDKNPCEIIPLIPVKIMQSYQERNFIASVYCTLFVEDAQQSDTLYLKIL